MDGALLGHGSRSIRTKTSSHHWLFFHVRSLLIATSICLITHPISTNAQIRGLGQLIFGFATTFELAVASRLVIGAFNGVVGTAKTVATELSSDEQQSIALNFISTVGQVATIIGPSVGGLTADPVKQYPDLFPAASSASFSNHTTSNFSSHSFSITKQFFTRFPFFLPNLVGFTLALMALIMIAMCLPETLQTRELGPTILTSEEIEMTKRETSPRYIPISTEGVPNTMDEGGNDSNWNDVKVLNISSTADGKNMNKTEEYDVESAVGLPNLTRHNSKSGIDHVQEMKNGSAGSPHLLLQNVSTRRAIMLYAGHSFTSITYNEVFPLWCVATADSGGLVRRCHMLSLLFFVPSQFLCLLEPGPQ